MGPLVPIGVSAVKPPRKLSSPQKPHLVSQARMRFIHGLLLVPHPLRGWGTEVQPRLSEPAGEGVGRYALVPPSGDGNGPA